MNNQDNDSNDVQIPGTVYLVGGAVRERIRAQDVATDQDWVVVGATTEEMQAAGFKQVGTHFPVFLHPVSGEEYALARVDRKQGKGHKGFVIDSNPNISIEEDLQRRDLTVNAIALAKNGTLVDPFNGLSDLDSKTLRHVSDAFVEDPLRVFRVARFAALLPDFEVAIETVDLMTAMSNELSALSAERVWVEYVKAMHGLTPHRFFETLSTVDAIDPWFSDLMIVSLVDLVRERRLRHANAVAALGWLHDERTVTKFCRRLKAPGKIFRLVRDVARHGQALCELEQKNPSDVMHLFQVSHALRPGEAFGRLVDAVESCSSNDLSGVRDLVQRLKLIRVEGVSSEEYGHELRTQRLKFIEAHYEGQ